MPQAYNPKVSIAMTTYNTAEYVKKAIKSVKIQSYDNWELVIVDDRSTDHTMKVVKKAVDHYGIKSKTKIIRRSQNGGYGQSLKTAIERGIGELVAIVDSDDALGSSKALSIMVAAHGKNPDASLIYSTYYVCRGKKLKVEGSKLKKITPIPAGKTYLGGKMRKWRVSHLKVFKRSSYNKTSGLDEQLLKSVDNDLILKLEEVGKLIYIDQPLYFYRRRAESITGMFSKRSKSYKLTAHRGRKAMVANARKRRGLG